MRVGAFDEPVDMIESRLPLNFLDCKDRKDLEKRPLLANIYELECARIEWSFAYNLLWEAK
jgi:hypothetical protein